MEKEFIQLVNDHRALIFKVCNLYCRDSESRKDLFQEVVLQLWRSFPGFRRESAGSTWIYRVALTDQQVSTIRTNGLPGRQATGRRGAPPPEISTAAIPKDSPLASRLTSVPDITIETTVGMLPRSSM